MSLQRRSIFVATLALASSALTGCAGLALPRVGAAPPIVGKVIIDLPPGSRDAAALAIQHANATRDKNSPDYLNGLQLAPFYIDDTLGGDLSPGMAAQRLSDLLTGPQELDFLGVIGPATETLAVREMPIASQARVAMISPTLTGPCLTQQQAFCPHAELALLYPRGSANGRRGEDFFFRVATDRSAEGTGAADWVYDALNARAAFVIDDHSPEYHAMAQDFGSRVEGNGGALVGSASVDPVAGRPPDSALRQAVLAKQPDVIFYAGADPAAAGQVRAALGHLPAGVRFVASDAAVGSQAFASAAGQFAEGCYAVGLQPDAAYTAQGGGLAGDFLAAFRQAYPRDVPDGSDLNAYLATEMLVRAIATASTTDTGQAVGLPQPSVVLQVLSPATAAGSQVVTAQSATEIEVGDNYGALAFDSNGDNLNQILTFDQLTPSGWTFVAQTSPVVSAAPTAAPEGQSSQ